MPTRDWPNLPKADPVPTNGITVRNLCLDYTSPLDEAERLTVLDGLSMTVRRGECVAVMGPNGSGKTSLCLALAGLAPRLTGGFISGEVRVGGRDVQTAPPGTLADLVGLVLQDPTGQLFNATVEDEIAWGLENLGTPVEAMRARIAWALKAVGLQDLPLEHAPQALSGGQQKRLALAAALALKPPFLILDEIAGGLDPAGRDEVVATLHGLRALDGLTVVMSESDSEVVAVLADRIVVLREGQIVYEGTPRDAFVNGSQQQLAHSGIKIPPAADFAVRLNATLGRRHYDFLSLDEVRAALPDMSSQASRQ